MRHVYQKSMNVFGYNVTDVLSETMAEESVNDMVQIEIE